MGPRRSYSDKHKLSSELRLRCPGFFEKYGASIIEECTYPQGFGSAWVIVQVDHLLLRFLWDPRDAGAIIELKSPRGFRNWEYLDAVIIRLTGRDTRKVPLKWEDWYELFSEHFALLNRTFV